MIEAIEFLMNKFLPKTNWYYDDKYWTVIEEPEPFFATMDYEIAAGGEITKKSSEAVKGEKVTDRIKALRLFTIGIDNVYTLVFVRTKGSDRMTSGVTPTPLSFETSPYFNPIKKYFVADMPEIVEHDLILKNLAAYKISGILRFYGITILIEQLKEKPKEYGILTKVFKIYR